MSKGIDLKKVLSDLENKGVLKQIKRILDEISGSCIRCNSDEIVYWDETDEEIIFRCKICKSFLTIPYRKDKLRFYFTS